MESHGVHHSTVPIVVTATNRSGIRLLELLEGGETEFVLSASSGSSSIRVHLERAPELEFGYGELTVNWSRGWISSPTGRVSLLRTELRLLAALLERRGEVVAPDHLTNCAWPAMRMDGRRDDLLQVYLHSLRCRLAAVGIARRLKTVRGLGYSFAP